MNYGGLQEVVRGLALCQAQTGHSVTIGCWTNLGNHPQIEAELAEAGVKVEYLRRGANDDMIYGRRRLYSKLKSHFGPGRSDVLHIHNPFGYYLYGALAARAAGVTKVLNTVHATAMFGHQRFGKRGRAQFWAAAMLSHRLVSVCDEVEAEVCRTFSIPRAKLAVIENGINLSPFLAVPARTARHEVVFGAVGRMSPEKNHENLIRAFAQVRRKHGNALLRLLGGGPLETRLRELANELGVAGSIDFRGFGHDVPGFLRDLDVFVLPSDSEGLPLSLLEAIASGLPVVATSVGGVPRVVNGTKSGWLSPPANPDSLARAMQEALFSPDRIGRGESARTLVEQKYSAKRMAEDYDRLYAELCGAAPDRNH
jgi:glycosyltransferase involved in cell wall biosynthesis